MRDAIYYLATSRLEINLDASNSDLSEKQIFRLRGVLKDISIPHLYRLAEKYGVEIPSDAADIFAMIDGFLDNLSLEAKKEILAEYGDAGRKSTYIFISEEKTPPIQTVFQKARTLLDIEPDSPFWENYPYYDEVDVDHLNRTLRIRFHYLKGTIFTLDRSGGQREHRLYHSGVVVYRPECKLLEVRVPHKSMGVKMAIRIPVHLGLKPFITLNLMNKELIRAFVDWISSLNSATIQLPISDVAGSLRITARRGMDLRTAARYTEELKYGRLRSGHVTIELSKRHLVNFRIFFRDCHIKYTLFTSEEGIGYIIDAMEKIAEGYKFAKPDRMLKEFFEKKD